MIWTVQRSKVHPLTKGTRVQWVRVFNVCIRCAAQISKPSALFETKISIQTKISHDAVIIKDAVLEYAFSDKKLYLQ